MAGPASALGITSPKLVVSPAVTLEAISPNGVAVVKVHDAATLVGAAESNVIYSGTIDAPKDFASWPITNGIVISVIVGAVGVSYTT